MRLNGCILRDKTVDFGGSKSGVISASIGFGWNTFRISWLNLEHL